MNERNNSGIGLIGVLFLSLAVSVGLCNPACAAQDSNSSTLLTAGGVKFAMTADYFTKYIWRGQNLNNGSVFQPAVSASACGFTGSVWGNMDLTTKNQHSGEFTEFDYSLDYTASVPWQDKVSFSVGAIYYDFPGTESDPTTEVYGGLNFDVPLSPYVKWYRDTQAINGSYVQLGVGHTIEKIWQSSDKCYCGLQVGSSIGVGSSRYNKGYFDTSGTKLNDWTSSIAFPFCLGDWTVKPSANYAMMLSDDIREATEKSDNFWLGITVTHEF